MNSEMFATEHVMMSSGQRSSLCHPSCLLNDNYTDIQKLHRKL